MTGINLKLLRVPTKQPDNRVGTILNRVEEKTNFKKYAQSTGLVTSGMLQCTQETGGFGWAISDYIEFAFVYFSCPTFTFGLDGTPQLDYSAYGDNKYSRELPQTIAEATPLTFQPAIFIPRVCHWYKEENYFMGCYLMIVQINPNCTEVNKETRLHFRFEGTGSIKE